MKKIAILLLLFVALLSSVGCSDTEEETTDENYAVAVDYTETGVKYELSNEATGEVEDEMLDLIDELSAYKGYEGYGFTDEGFVVYIREEYYSFTSKKIAEDFGPSIICKVYDKDSDEEIYK